MIELILAAMAETAEYEEEALRLAVHYNCDAHQIPGRSFEDGISVATERFLSLGYPADQVARELEQIVRVYREVPPETSSVEFCHDMFDLLYPGE